MKPFLSVLKELPNSQRSRLLVKTVSVVLVLLMNRCSSVTLFLAFGRYRGSDKCPCGSGRQIWACHGNKIEEFRSNQASEMVIQDLSMVMHELEERKELLAKRKEVTLSVRSGLQSMWKVSR